MSARCLGLSLLAIALLFPGSAYAGRTLTLRFPRVVVPAGTTAELCVFLKVPRGAPFDWTEYEVRHRGVGGSFALSHFLVYAYQGARLAEVSPGGTRVVASRGCLEVGPGDPDERQLLFAAASARSRGATPAGTAVRLAPDGASGAIGFLLDADVVNGSATPRRLSSLVRLRAARPRSLKRMLRPILERTAEAALLVPPGETGSTEQSTVAWNAGHPGAGFLRDAWGPGLSTTGTPAPTTAACVLRLSGHFHKRGRFFGADFVDGEGTVALAEGARNPFEPGRRHLFGTSDHTDPGEATFSPPRLLRLGESFRYGCWIDNGVTQPARRGCEEILGVVPGGARVAGGVPAKPCGQINDASTDCPAADVAFPGRTFTGRCVLANIVAGTTADDEACALAGFYYAATAAGSCDLAGEPAASDPP